MKPCPACTIAMPNAYITDVKAPLVAQEIMSFVHKHTHVEANPRRPRLCSAPTLCSVTCLDEVALQQLEQLLAHLKPHVRETHAVVLQNTNAN